ARPLGVNAQAPAALAAVVPSTTPPSLIVTVAFWSPEPLIVGLLVIPSLADAPVSLTSATVTAGAVISSVKLSAAEPVLPARSVSDALSVCALSPRPVGTKLQAPAALAVVVPSTTPPSLIVTVAFWSPDPWIAGLLVIPSLADAPVSLTST